MTETTYTGHCHCSALGFRYVTALSPADWSVRACQCRFCRMHDALSTSDPAGRLAFTDDNLDQLQRYRFALQTADFLLCRRCGVYIGAVIDVDGFSYGIINTHALDTTPPDIATVSAASYDDEDVGGRAGRRARRWTPVTPARPSPPPCARPFR